MGNDSIIAKNLKQAVAQLTQKATHVYLRRNTQCDMLVSPGERSDPAFHASHRLCMVHPDADGTPMILVTLLVEYRIPGKKVEVTFDFIPEADGPRFMDGFPEEWFDIAPERCPEWRARRRGLTHPAARARRERREARATARKAVVS
jgi:hypothetical protein